jgi:hypothetical protein
VPRQDDDDELIPSLEVNLCSSMYNSLRAVMTCDGCGTCLLDLTILQPCCGCTCLLCKYGAMPDPRPDNPIPGTITFPSFEKRDIETGNPSPPSSNFSSPTKKPPADVDRYHRSSLAARQARRAPKDTRKKPLICKAVVETEMYPPYPDRNNRNSDAVDFELMNYPAIVKYISCTSWAVGKYPRPADRWDSNRRRWPEGEFY